MVSDPVEAARRIHGMDEMLTGLIFQADLPVWQPEIEQQATIEQIGEEFRV